MEETEQSVSFMKEVISIYRKMKDKWKQSVSDKDYTLQIENWLISMFQYDPDIYRPDLLEFLLHRAGMAALIKTDTAEFTPVIVNFADGERYADGWFSTAYCYDGRGYQYRFEDWERNPDICVIFNNYTRTCDNWIEKYAYLLTEIDTSLDCNIFFSRMKRIPVTDDQTVKHQIDTAIDDISVGKIKTILSQNSVKSLIGGDTSIDILDLTDVSKSQYLQYLSHLYDAIKSRVYENIGLGYADGAKQAQISIDELKRNENAEFLNPSVWYESRKNAFDKYEKKSGIRLNFDFSPLWKSSIQEKNGGKEIDKNTGNSDNAILSDST